MSTSSHMLQMQVDRLRADNKRLIAQLEASDEALAAATEAMKIIMRVKQADENAFLAQDVNAELARDGVEVPG